MAIHGKRFNKSKEFSGILVSEKNNGTGYLNFLTAEGVYYRILKNNKYKQLQEKTGECVRVVGKTISTSIMPVIEILSFVNEFDSQELSDDLDSFVDNDNISQMTFFDYESFYT